MQNTSPETTTQLPKVHLRMEDSGYSPASVYELLEEYMKQGIMLKRSGKAGNYTCGIDKDSDVVSIAIPENDEDVEPSALLHEIVHAEQFTNAILQGVPIDELRWLTPVRWALGEIQASQIQLEFMNKNEYPDIYKVGVALNMEVATKTLIEYKFQGPSQIHNPYAF